MRAVPLTFAAAILLSAAGCATRPERLGGSTGPLILEHAFLGRSYATGYFKNTITGQRRDFKVRLDGVSKGGAFLLTERFDYADGEKGVKTWRFERLGEGHYRGMREDVVGFADVAR